MSDSRKIAFLSFIPAVAYWYLETNYSVRIAVIGGVGLAFAEVLFELIFFKKVHEISKFNFFVMLLLGGLSLADDNGIWFKLQPALSAFAMVGFLLYNRLRDKSLMWSFTSESQRKVLSKKSLARLELHMMIFLVLWGVWMSFVAFRLSTDSWIFHKTIGFYIAVGIFMIVEIILTRVLRSHNAPS